jgi:hypothetical protein
VDVTDSNAPRERTIFYELMEHLYPDERERAERLAELNGAHIVDVLPLALNDDRGRLHIAVCRRGDFQSEPCSARSARRAGRHHGHMMNGTAAEPAVEEQPVS